MQNKSGSILYLVFTFCLGLTVSLRAQSISSQKVDSISAEMWASVFTNPGKAKKLGEEGIIIAKKSSYQKGLAELYARLGVLYDITGKPEMALPHFLDAIKIQEQIKDSAGLSFSYNNLGLMYYAQFDYKNAYKNLNASLIINLKRNDLNRAAGAMVNLGIVNAYLDSIERSELLYNRALDIYTDLKDSSGMMSCYSNLANVYYNQREYKTALNYFLLLEKYWNSKGNPEKKASNYVQLANVHSKLKLFEKALNYAFKGLQTCEENGLVEKKQYSYENLNDIYIEMGDYKNAHIYLNKYILLRDSLLNEDRNSTLAEMQAKYETEKKDNEILKVNSERDKAVQKSAMQFNYIIAIIMFFLLVVTIIFVFLRSKQRLNKVLEEKNNLNEEIIRQKEMMIGEVHHRVKNNLQLINSIIELQIRNYQDQETISAVDDIRKRVNSIALLHQYLYQKENIDSIDMYEYMYELMNGLQQSFHTPAQNIYVECNVQNIQLHINTAVSVGLLVNELITNSFKHAFQNRSEGTIEISLKKENDTLILEVNDDGSGIKMEENNNFGRNMIRSLCRQLQAEWIRETNSGLKNKFVIKKFKE